LGIAWWFVATKEVGRAGRMRFIFFWVWNSHSVQFFYKMPWETRAFSLSLWGWQVDQVCMCVSLVSSGHLGYFLFFVHSFLSI
jgi:hypothetical protein